MSGEEPLTETLFDRNGNQLFWQKDVTYAEIIDGFPYVNGKQVYMDTEKTDYEVRVYKYNTTTKMLINFGQVDGVNVPKIEMGNVVITDSDVTINGVSLASLSAGLGSTDQNVSALETRLAAAEATISGQGAQIADLIARVTALETPDAPTE